MNRTEEIAWWREKLEAAYARLTSLSQANERMAGALQEITDYEPPADDSWSAIVGTMRDIAAAALSDLSAPPGDSKPVAWRFEQHYPQLNEWDWCISLERPDEGNFIRNITPLYAHPPGDSDEVEVPPRCPKCGYWVCDSGPPPDSIDKAIEELEKTGWKFKLGGPHKSLETGLTKFRCELLSPIVPPGRKPHSADGPTPLSAIRAAMGRIPK